jgi:hypothetical protein
MKFWTRRRRGDGDGQREDTHTSSRVEMDTVHRGCAVDPRERADQKAREDRSAEEEVSLGEVSTPFLSSCSTRSTPCTHQDTPTPLYISRPILPNYEWGRWCSVLLSLVLVGCTSRRCGVEADSTPHSNLARKIAICSSVRHPNDGMGL